MSEPLTILREGTWTETDRRIRLIPQYRCLRDIELARVQTESILSLAQFINTRRLSFAEALAAKVVAAGIPLFRPVVVRIGDLTRLVIPPVVEEHEGQLVLFDGTHRVWVARYKGMPNIDVVVVRGVGLPLPSKPVSWERVTQRDDKYTTEENLVAFDRTLFRPVTTTFNGPDTLLYEGDPSDNIQPGDPQ